MTQKNVLKNYRLDFWHIKGNFVDFSLFDIIRETKILN